MNKIHITSIFLIGTAVLANCNLFAKEHLEIKKISFIAFIPCRNGF